MNYLQRLPLIPTIIVALAIAVMIALGFWQLGRADEKAELLARYAAAGDNQELVAWPGEDKDALKQRLYRRSKVVCARVTELSAVAGTNARGSHGWAQIAQCELKGGGEARIALGWTRVPDGPLWNGGEVTGIVAPGRRPAARWPAAVAEARSFGIAQQSHGLCLAVVPVRDDRTGDLRACGEEAPAGAGCGQRR